VILKATLFLKKHKNNKKVTYSQKYHDFTLNNLVGIDLNNLVATACRLLKLKYSNIIITIIQLISCQKK
jgi:hypothetical protein